MGIRGSHFSAPIFLPALRSALAVRGAPTPHRWRVPANWTCPLFRAPIREGAKPAFFDQVTAYKHLVIDRLLRDSDQEGLEEPISFGLSHVWSGVGSHLPVEVTVIALGDQLAIVCLPGEVFVELGLAIKQASPFRTTLVMHLANCVETIYLPTRVAYAGGSYEVTNSTVQHGSGEQLAETAVRLLRDAASSLEP